MPAGVGGYVGDGLGFVRAHGAGRHAGPAGCVEQPAANDPLGQGQGPAQDAQYGRGPWMRLRFAAAACHEAGAATTPSQAADVGDQPPRSSRIRWHSGIHGAANHDTTHATKRGIAFSTWDRPAEVADERANDTPTNVHRSGAARWHGAAHGTTSRYSAASRAWTARSRNHCRPSARCVVRNARASRANPCTGGCSRHEHRSLRRSAG